ncbi:NAD(P)/FAD-dependent oxidoreductase [Paenibacillus woosongensis]|uniref:NAD(P)/FAD-dependent oxidoreductase n=1 Tax=Paenibacillus woosongensis TaxID=307580 RepID=A0AA95L3A5_9BACL|nr:NAD(P)/FAD-dependent oxidoreductase [Paenibacillus woosongensis]WHX51252.1 NAD(P)/FAD-dependent oxidoreductase [Paenibacillus woosongensis]
MPRDCIIVGGGIAGLQAAIQLGRYSAYDVLVVDAGEGRSTLCRGYHNILGWPDGISGQELRARGRHQAESTGVRFAQDRIVTAARTAAGTILLKGETGQTYETYTTLLATGVSDRIPEIPGLVPLLGSSVYICPDCDGYEIEGKCTVLMGSGDAGANMALLLAERTNSLTYVNHESSRISPELLEQMGHASISYIEAAIVEIRSAAEGQIEQIILHDGTVLPAERGFIAFGGNKVHSDLARQLGAVLSDNGHVESDPRSKQTSVDNVWAAGDIALHAEQATVAMGEGSIAAIWINKALRAQKGKFDQRKSYNDGIIRTT